MRRGRDPRASKLQAEAAEEPRGRQHSDGVNDQHPPRDLYLGPYGLYPLVGCLRGCWEMLRDLSLISWSLCTFHAVCWSTALTPSATWSRGAECKPKAPSGWTQEGSRAVLYCFFFVSALHKDLSHIFLDFCCLCFSRTSHTCLARFLLSELFQSLYMSYSPQSGY